MLTKKQIAANQKRSIKTLIERIERLEMGFGYIDQSMDEYDEILNDDV